jgi:hypothetical protein
LFPEAFEAGVDTDLGEPFVFDWRDNTALICCETVRSVVLFSSAGLKDIFNPPVFAGAR